MDQEITKTCIKLIDDAKALIESKPEEYNYATLKHYAVQLELLEETTFLAALFSDETLTLDDIRLEMKARMRMRAERTLGTSFCYFVSPESACNVLSLLGNFQC